jgi:hypothetical protein
VQTLGGFADAWPWVPERDAAGHPLGPGKINLSWQFCTCPAAGEAGGHHSVRCRVPGCHAPAIRPPECDRTLDQR